MGNKVFVAGYAHGNFTFTTKHVTNGATGEIDNHDRVPTFHATETFAYGRYHDVASSQNGEDAIVVKLSDEGDVGDLLDAAAYQAHCEA